MKILSIVYLCIILLSACTGQQNKTNSKSDAESIINNAKVTVFYFHGTVRCINCVATQKVAQQTVNEYYAGNKDVEIDISVKENQALAEKYQVFFSGLVIANAKTYNDITLQALSLSDSQPDRLKELIVDEVNSLLTI
jgi:hypothetical protein